MSHKHIIRRFELGLVPATIIGYLIFSLTHDANIFEIMMRAARRAGVSVHQILKDLSHYDHTMNHNLPVIVSAMLCMAAWYLFHYHIYPKIKTTDLSWFDITLIVIMIGLIVSGTFILLNTIEIEYRQNNLGAPIGFKDVSKFRYLFVLSDSVVIFSIICIYEAFAQFYYRLYDKLEANPNGRKLNYFIAVLVFGLFFILAISERIVPLILMYKGSRQILTIFIFLIFVYILQQYYFKKVHPVMHSPALPPNAYLPFLLYLLTGITGAIMIWVMTLRFPHSSSPVIIVLTAFTMYAFSLPIAYYRKSQEKEKTALKTQVSVKSAELSNLRSQINPHFLFNALNSLYATALKENGAQTADGIQKLGDMMRFMLDENNHDRIPLQSEIDYLHNYIAIQKMRVDETQNVEIRVNIQDPETEIFIAPMLLNPFIENAFKHGISFQYPSWIYVTLTLDSNRIFFKVHNSFHQTLSHDPEQSHSGIGLENVRKRLALIYPGKHHLEIQKSDKDHFISLTLQR